MFDYTKIQSKWITITELENKGRKTKIFEVRAIHDDFFLGTISWDTGWRRYVFQPSCAEPIKLCKDCMNLISNFMDKLMEDRKINNKKSIKNELDFAREGKIDEEYADMYSEGQG